MEEPSFIAPKYSSDEIKLQLIFPEDIWLLIFNKLNGSSDYHRIDAASPYFHHLLLPLRTRILFPEVIIICFDYTFLTKESLFQCRYACKTWRKGVDTAFHQILSEINTSPTDWKRFSCDLQIMNCNQLTAIYHPNNYVLGELDNFLEFFHDSHFLTASNPFPTRSIGIEIRVYESVHKFFDILQIYGHHIWHCMIQLFFANSEEHQQVVLSFCKLLSLLPNLHTLRVFTSDGWGLCNTEYLKPILTANPMPYLKDLKILTCNGTARPIVSELIQKNPQIKGLRVSDLDFSNPSALFSTPLPNLAEFHIMGLRSSEDFSEMQNLHIQWQLTKLSFFSNGSSNDTLNINHVFNWIEAKWSQTLKELNIYIPLPVSEVHPWSLPNLTTLRIQMARYACLDFILSLSKSLVHLSVDHSGRDEYSNSLEKESKIQFFSHRTNLGTSNIWKFFPRLREIHYADDLVRGPIPTWFYGRTYRRNHWVGYSLEGIDKQLRTAKDADPAGFGSVCEQQHEVKNRSRKNTCFGFSLFCCNKNT